MSILSGRRGAERVTAFDALFGIEEERKIAQSRVREVFTPHQPISEAELLFGRQDEVKRLVQTLSTPGQHVLLFGERGIGKSSLANVVSIVLRHILDTALAIFVKRCDRSDTFESIVTEPLMAVGADLNLVEFSEETAREAGVGFKGISARRARAVVETYRASQTLSPSTVADALLELPGLLVVDEADAIAGSDDRRKLAELIKLLSDGGSPFKVMVVGIADTGTELTAAHPSVQRCLRETRLGRMTEGELTQIITSGARATNLYFEQEVQRRIVDISAGYPHFTHLIALKCAERAVLDSRMRITADHLPAALASAVQDSEGTLREQYDRSIRSFSTDMYKSIVAAAARLTSIEITAADLRASIQHVTGDEISQNSLNNYLQRLVSDDGTTIMTRISKGVYRFTDPRMASFARMVGGTE